MLTERQLQIFRAIIDHFTWTVQPVGSKNLLKESDLPYSSATIRNEMSVLEEYGFIEKTHSSSGRVPSEKGYRFYVDYLLKPKKLSKEDRQIIQSVFQADYDEAEEVIQNSASLLSELTSYTSIVLGPNSAVNKLSGFRFVPISRQQAMLILITDQGHVDNHLVTLPIGVTPSDMERTVNILNDRLVGVPLDALETRIEHEVEELLTKHVENAEYMSEILLNTFHRVNKERIYLGGKTNILNQPEFHDIAKIRGFLQLVEAEDVLYDLFRDIPDGVSVKFGRELNNEFMDDLSIITATYRIADERVGGIVLLGPTRMEYSRMLGLVDVFSQDLTTVLTKLYHENQK
ncbi:heat-inducible transcriptional repressor HrcA [Listeria fleischmannii]|uniref:Heat-inducible transcription repressor HrcA n=1 Tax=Listeria fleischmannii TaxID=1069827 RepID=A0A841YGP3_9LIST|nr:heat-inducible transcriptional repressor HrcA [Listeria fleischmannii]EIA20320.1 heat-inducible transcription repressor [Listeria fleischmannii subsp. coloradonensis]MBC1399268.1 heat-inducible transcription repressor HrcA [Listeria fleischmannii]MBC1419034.1 heat-inducible transcription repressor HrcA [Listeria fleischmannii]MBC1427580.1 heat-inducible transcription repressor HrcA [Listeria fleischmannii]STY34923.1 Heat-inducible transcription repressor HrcA [Listeria fleischmannii subsp. 